MNLLNKDDVIFFHREIVEETSGMTEVRDEGLLEAAIMDCFQSFDGEQLYPTMLEKAARLAYSLSKNHAFIDGNKRIAVVTMLAVLKIDDIILHYTQKELIQLGLEIADGSLDYMGIVNWINNHITEHQKNK